MENNAHTDGNKKSCTININRTLQWYLHPLLENIISPCDKAHKHNVTKNSIFQREDPKISECILIFKGGKGGGGGKV